MALSVAAAILGSAALSGGLSYLSGSHQQNKANDFNEYMWNQQNRYNSPAEQMKRLKEAGLNPYLYANSLGGNQAGSPVPSAQGYTGDFGVADATNHMLNYKSRKDELDLKKQVLNKTKLDNGILGEQKRQLQLQNRLLEKQIDKVTAGIDYMKVEQNNKWNEAQLNRQQRQYEFENRPAVYESKLFGIPFYSHRSSNMQNATLLVDGFGK